MEPSPIAAETEFSVPPQILLMEDEYNIAKGLEMVLTDEGYGVDLTNSGENALKKFGQKNFDLLVADLRLPDMDGLEVIKEVKELKVSIDDFLAKNDKGMIKKNAVVPYIEELKIKIDSLTEIT